MAENSKIEWCDHTASPWHGCEKVSTGCDNCYAEKLSGRNPGVLGVWGSDGVRVKSKSFASNLRAWDKQAKKDGRTFTVFPSLCDPFEDRSELVEWRQEMFQLADECQNVTLLLLTKRPENIWKMWPLESYPMANGWTGMSKRFRKNIWLGTSVENQEQAENRIPELLKCRDLSPVLFLSCEPLLGPLDLNNIPKGIKRHGEEAVDSLRGEVFCNAGFVDFCESINWVIVGGESGPNARPIHPDWVRSIRDQCADADVPFLFKQWGEWKPECSANYAIGKNQYVYGLVEGISILRDGSVCLRNCKEKPADKCEIVNEFALSRFHSWMQLPYETDQQKQWRRRSDPAYQWMHKVGKKAAGRLIDGHEWNQFPEVPH